MIPDNVSSYREDKPHLYSLELMPHEQRSLDALPKDVLEALENGDIELALALLNERGEGKVASKFKQLQKLAMLGLPLQKLMNRLGGRKSAHAQSSWESGKAKKKGKKEAQTSKIQFTGLQAIFQAPKKGMQRLTSISHKIGAVFIQLTSKLGSIRKGFSLLQRKLSGKLELLRDRVVAFLQTPIIFAKKIYTSVQGWIQEQKEKGERAIKKVRELFEPIILKIQGKINTFVEKQQERLAPVVKAVKEQVEVVQKLIQESVNKFNLALIQPLMVRITAVTHGIVQWFNWTKKITNEYRDGVKETLSGQSRRFKKGIDHFNAVFVRGVNSLYVLTVDYALSFMEKAAASLQVIFRWLLGQLMRVFFAGRKIIVRVCTIFWLILKTISMILWTVVKAFSEAILFAIRRSLKRS